MGTNNKNSPLKHTGYLWWPDLEKRISLRRLLGIFIQSWKWQLADFILLFATMKKDTSSLLAHTFQGNNSTFQMDQFLKIPIILKAALYLFKHYKSNTIHLKWYIFLVVIGYDERNFHTLRYGDVILAYTWVNLYFMLTKTAYLWPIKHTLYICFNHWRKVCITRNKECPC